MQNAILPPPATAPLPFFAWAIPPECQWRDIAGREPHQPLARDLLAALLGGAVPDRGGVAAHLAPVCRWRPNPGRRGA